MAISKHAPTPPVTPFPSDPILIALARHRDAWAWLVHAPAEDRPAAARAQVDALADVLATPCTTAAGAGCLLRHLRACLAPAGAALGLAPQAVGLITARAADLSLLMELPGARAPIPLGEAAAAVVRSLNRFGEVAAALVIVVGGIVLTGAASLL